MTFTQWIPKQISIMVSYDYRNLISRLSIKKLFIAINIMRCKVPKNDELKIIYEYLESIYRN